MKIAMIGHKRVPSREGGVEIVVENISERMVKKGHDVSVYNRYNKNFRSSKEYKGIHIITVPTINKKFLDALIYTFFATIKSASCNYDIIHFHAEGPCFFIWLPHILKKRIIVTIHGLDWQRGKWGGLATKFLLYCEKMAVKYADEIIVLSQNNAKYFIDKYNRQTILIPNGVNKAENIEIKKIKEKFNLKKDEYILFLARIVPEKGLHYLLEAFKMINTQKKLVIAGGSSHSDAYYDQIKRRAQLDNRIIMTGFVSGTILEELYSNAYLYVLPSDVEGMPIGLLEAMSYGNCCLLSNIHELTEILDYDDIIFEKGNIDDLKNKLESLLFNKKIVEKYRVISKEKVKEYDWNNVGDRTLKVYKADSISYENFNGK